MSGAGGIVRIPGVPGFGDPYEEAASSVIPEIEWVLKRWPDLVLTDAYDGNGSGGHSSAGHNVTGTAADFSGPDDSMNAAVKQLVSYGYTVGYDGSFGSEAWAGHGPSTVTSNYHFHVEFGSGGSIPGVAGGGGAVRGQVAVKTGAAGFIPGAVDKVAGVAGDAAMAAAKALFALIWDALGEDGLRVVLYVVLVGGAMTLGGLGISRMSGGLKGAPA